RHGCGYALADNGIDTRLIQDYLGHRNIRHTVIYTASNSARFDRVWNRSKKGKKQLFDPNCKPPALQDAILKNTYYAANNSLTNN
ncbi:tyrosine-type recombinase/integrase, partial [Citrobacter freundii]